MSAGFGAIVSTAVMHPAEVIVGDETHGQNHGNLDDLKEVHVHGVNEVDTYQLEDDIMQEQALPEGPTVTRWEEWAYVSD
jgi:hypothetical protein